MATAELISLLASIASLIVSIGAIWLSITFFRMSTAASATTTEAAKGIAASVERLENLFDKLYADTFSMMRDTVSDMRKHIWPAEEPEGEKTLEEVEKRADERINELKGTVEKQLAGILQRQDFADNKVMAVSSEMRRLIDRTIATSRQIDFEAREETLREHILRQLRIAQRRQAEIAAEDLVLRLHDRFPANRVIMELGRMKIEGLVVISQDEIGPATTIRLANAVPHAARERSRDE